MTKPYDFVPFLKCEVYKENGNLEGSIPITIKTLTPIHISSGKYKTNDNKSLYKEFIRVNEDIIIPGTSFKGCIRNIAEAVSYSCLNSRGLKFDLPPNKKHSKEKRCIICDMFGTMGFKSKIVVSDFKLISGKTEIISLPESYKPRPDTDFYINEKKIYKGYKFYKHGIIGVQRRGKIPYEFIIDGSEFQGEIRFKRLTEKQLELLCFSMGLSGDFEPKIGYGKAHYYGSIEVLSDEKWVKKAQKYKNTANKDIRENIEYLMDILRYKNAVRSID